MDERHEFRARSRHSIGDAAGRDVGAPFRFDGCHITAATGGDIRYPAAEIAVDTDDNSVPRFNHVDEGSFHASGTSAGNWESQPVFSAEHLTKQRDSVIHHANKGGI